MAYPFPRFTGSRSTRAPARSAISAVPSMEPSSTTISSRSSGVCAAQPSTTERMVAASL